LTPKKTLFAHRLYRNSCIKTKSDTSEDVYVKDLRIFKGFDLSKIVIIDNSILSFSFQLENGIPILPFKDNKNDNEFPILVNYLNHLASVDDVRLENKKYLKLNHFLNQQKIVVNSVNSTNSMNSSNCSYSEEYTSNSDSISRFTITNNQNNNNNTQIVMESSIISTNSNNNNDLSKISEKSDVNKIRKNFEENIIKFYKVFKK